MEVDVASRRKEGNVDDSPVQCDRDSDDGGGGGHGFDASKSGDDKEPILQWCPPS